MTGYGTCQYGLEAEEWRSIIVSARTLREVLHDYRKRRPSQLAVYFVDALSDGAL